MHHCTIRAPLNGRLVSALLLSISAMAANAASPIGAVTSIVGSTINGWACDPDTPGQAVAIHFYANAPWSKYRGGNIAPDHLAGSTVANLTNAAQSAACLGGQHGFAFTVSRDFRSRIGPGSHQFYIYLLDTNGMGQTPS